MGLFYKGINPMNEDLAFLTQRLHLLIFSTWNRIRISTYKFSGEYKHSYHNTTLHLSSTTNIHSKIMTDTKLRHHLEYYRNIHPTIRLNSDFHRHVLKASHLYFLSAGPLLDYKIPHMKGLARIYFSYNLLWPLI